MTSVIVPAVAAAPRKRLALRLLAGTALVLLATPFAAPALADGGRGGDGYAGAAGGGGLDNPIGAGGAGLNGTGQFPGGGGGGGGAGAVTGGAGGFDTLGDSTIGRGGTGGVHGFVGSGLPLAGSVGSNGGGGGGSGWYETGGGGGGGGGYGAVITGAGALGILSGSITGGNGGSGAGSQNNWGGSGGSGGIGLFFTAGSVARTLTVTGTVQGGNGGHGGGSGYNLAGSGGAGGVGIMFANGSATTTLTVTGTVQGGNGGSAGPGYPAGELGAGGAGIVGSNLSITTSGTISGGTDIGGGNRAAAIRFTGGANSLTFGNATSGLIGDIVIEAGTLTFAQPADVTVDNIVSGAGAVIKTGTGTLTLTQENTYSGGTTIAGGAISISKESNLGNTSGTLTLDGGVLQITGTTLNGLARTIILGSNGGGFDIVEAGNSFIVNQSLSGTGSLAKTGAGTLVLKGASSYSGATTVSEGTLRAGAANAFSANSTFTVASGTTLDLAGFSQTIASLAGAGTVTLGSGTLTAGSDNTSTTFSGTITGTGGVTKTGTGTLTLTGTNTYTGSTKVSSGKLVVNGSLASTVTLDGGTLGGSGTIAGVSVGSGATVAPGNSIGTLTVSGNVSFASGSTYQVEVNAAGQSDRIVASGSATLSGGTVQVLAESGNYAASTNYTILTASGGVNGTFTSVTSNLAFLTPSLSYGGTNVTLTMTRNDTSFGPDNSGGSSGGTSVAATRNQGFIAMAAERLGVGNPVYDALISATAEEARAGFDLLSGEAHAQAVSVMIDESRLVRDTILGHLRGPLLTQAPGQVAGAFTADLPGRKSGIVMPAPVPQPRYALWGTAFGSTGNTDADGNAASLSRRSGGALLGADVMLYEAPGSSLKVGVAGGYSQSRFDLDARLSTGKLESGHAALYAGARFGQLRLDAGAAYTWSESDIRRQVAIRGFGDLLRLQRPGSVTQGFAELGYGFTFQGIALEPFAQLALIRVSTDAGTERGGATALRVLSSDQTLGFTTLGLRAEAQLGAMPLFARAMLGWRHGFGELTPQARTAFVAGTTPAQVFAAPIDRDALTAEAGLDWRISSATALGLTYSAAIGERSRDHALKGRVEMRF
ncbi:Outer membrane autotransporter barrel domain-containing protein (fragment) [Bosea sp. EC-HK365B]|uniref:autotransporter outer membrane beta-barrel domain-containing protein n=1 Tax=Bosea sp. EC-HK365B TaxID=2038386 RepID=UPI0012574BD9